MKKLSILLWVIVAPFVGNAQKATISWSPLQTRPKHQQLQKIFHLNDKGFYTYVKSPYDSYKGFYVEKHDVNNVLEFRKEIKPKDKDMFVKDVFPIKTGYLILFGKYMNEKFILYGQKYSFTGDPVSEPYEIGKLHDLSYCHRFMFMASKDGSKILAYQFQKGMDISFNVRTTIKNPVLQLLAFDIEEGALWSKVLEYEKYFGSNLIEEDAQDKFLFDNDGQLYMITDKNPLRVIRYNHEDDKMEEYTIPLDGTNYQYKSCSFNETMDKILIGGLGYIIDSKSKLMVSESIVYARIDVETFKVDIANVIPFSKNIAAKIKKFERESYLTRYDLSKSIVKEDNGLIITVESQYTGPENKEAFMDAYVFNVSPNGTLIGEGNIIPKYQKGIINNEGATWSFAPIYLNGNIHLFYYDVPENLLPGAEKKEAEMIKNHEKGIWVMATIDKNGILKREQMEQTLGFNTVQFKKLTQNKFLIYRSTYKDYKFGSLTIQ